MFLPFIFHSFQVNNMGCCRLYATAAHDIRVTLQKHLSHIRNTVRETYGGRSVGPAEVARMILL